MKRKATPSFWDAEAAPSRLHEELHVALGALEELGPAYEPQVRDALLERLNQAQPHPRRAAAGERRARLRPHPRRALVAGALILAMVMTANVFAHGSGRHGRFVYIGRPYPAVRVRPTAPFVPVPPAAPPAPPEAPAPPAQPTL